MKYLVILLADNSLSYCHYPSSSKGHKLIDLEMLKLAIKFGMKHNLMIQFIYPDGDLPEGYEKLIETIDSVKYKSIYKADVDDVGIAKSWPEDINNIRTNNVIIRRPIDELMHDIPAIDQSIRKFSRINIVISDIENIIGQVEIDYKQWIARLSGVVLNAYKEGFRTQINLITDRIMLKEPNHCNAGIDSVTVAPDGKFYICPAFYYSGMNNVGSVTGDWEIKNQQLLKLSNAPICKICDAYHCRRCLYLNKKLTHEVNTPSRQQCVVAHIEREASRILSESLKTNEILEGIEIPELQYYDPFIKIAKY